MGKIIGSVKRLFSRRSKAAEEHDSMGVVEDSPYYPFCWREKEDGEYAVVLYQEEEYKTDIFEEKKLQGNGYDWVALSKKLISEEMPDAEDVVKFDPKADMFYAYSGDKETLYRFMTLLKALSDDDERMERYLAGAQAEANLI